MARNILVINVDFKETRVALIEDGVIAELQIERAAHRSTVGNIVLGRVTRVLPGMQAAFIDVGQERAAFLHVEDLIRPDDFDAYLASDVREKVKLKSADQSPAEDDEDTEGDPQVGPADTASEAGAERAGGRRGRRRRGRRGRGRDRAAELVAGSAPENVSIDDSDLNPTLKPGEVIHAEHEHSHEHETEDDGSEFEDEAGFDEEVVFPSIGGYRGSGSGLFEDIEFGESEARAKGDVEPSDEDDAEFDPEDDELDSDVDDLDSEEELDSDVDSDDLDPDSEEVPDSDEDDLDDEDEDEGDEADEVELDEDELEFVEAEVGESDDVADDADDTDDDESEDDDVDDDDDESDEADDATSVSPDAGAEPAIHGASEGVERPSHIQLAESLDGDEPPPSSGERVTYDNVEAVDGAELPSSVHAAPERSESEDASAPGNPDERRRRGRRRRRRGAREGAPAEAPQQAVASEQLVEAAAEAREDIEGGRRNRRRRGRKRGRPDVKRPEGKAQADATPTTAEKDGGRRMPLRVSRSVPITDVVKEGNLVVVQISKEPIGTKGARVTSHVSLPGRYVVYLPTVDHVGISKRIGNAKERARLRKSIEAIKPANGGLIVRTVAEGLTKKQLKADIGYLIKLWADVAKRRETAKPAELLYEELDLVLKAARDLFTDEVQQIVIDDREQHGRLCRFVEMFMPGRVKDIKLYSDDEPIFDAYGIEDEIKRALSRKVPLPSGGSLIMDQAEALTAIDVNTGRYVGKGSKDLEETAVKTNLEAVDEIAYQLRFRNIGGLVILDLIDMEKAENREKVWRALEQKLAKDKAKTTINRISELGLIEMTRKRTRESLGRIMHEPCFYCDGTGNIQSRETIAYEILRQIRRDRMSLTGYSVRVVAHPAVVDFLKHEAKDALQMAERRYMRRIELVPRPEYHIEQYDLQGR